MVNDKKLIERTCIGKRVKSVEVEHVKGNEAVRGVTLHFQDGSSLDFFAFCGDNETPFMTVIAS